MGQEEENKKKQERKAENKKKNKITNEESVKLRHIRPVGKTHESLSEQIYTTKFIF